MVNRAISTVVAAQSGLMRNSIVAFLNNLPQVKVLDSVEDISMTLQSIKRHLPKTLVIDASICDPDLTSHLNRLHQDSPSLNCIVLVDSLQQQREAVAAGAKYALLKGMLSETLTHAILGYSNCEAEAK